jgi:hypothetical protein
VATVTGAIVDGIDITDAQNVVQIFAGSVSDVFTVSDALSVIRGIPITVTDGIGVHDALLSQLGVLVIETLLLQETLGPQFTYHLTATDGVGLHDALVRGLPGSITDGIGIHDVQLVAQMVRIIESLGLTDVITPAAKYNLAITENVQFTSLLARFFGASIVENMQWVGSAVAVGQLHQALAENIGIHDDTTNSRMVFRATVSDTLDVTDAALIKMIFQGAITEGIQISAAYIEPSGSITTWAMNTRSAAVTEYTNYAFNSFARMGNKYLGATKDGLYELTGDTDNGTSIIADLKSGLAQFAGVHLSSFKAAYIAARGGGNFIVRVTTGDGSKYDYAVTTQSMKTARINIGKGIRARYFAFELISTGQDFDLDSLEFIPLVAKRRV